MALFGRKKRDGGFDFRRASNDRSLAWDEELKGDSGITAHDPGDDGPRIARRDRPIPGVPTAKNRSSGQTNPPGPSERKHRRSDGKKHG